MIDEKGLHKAIGAELKKIRKKKGYNQSDLAEKIGLERTSITNIETGRQKATVTVLYKICGLFDIEISDLLPRLSEVAIHKVEATNDEALTVGSKTFAVLNRIRKS